MGRRRRVDISDLNNPEEYEVILQLNHQEILPFIQDEFNGRNFLIHLYILINIGLVTASIYFGIGQWFAGTIAGWKMLVFMILGATLGSTLIIPIHELIHGLVYYLLGAKKVSYGWNLQSFYFYAVADRFVVSDRGIWPLALAPFTLISAACIYGILHTSGITEWTLWGLLIMHSLNCLGDFGVLSFFWRNRAHRIYTYDLVSDSISFFYAKKTDAEDQLEH